MGKSRNDAFKRLKRQGRMAKTKEGKVLVLPPGVSGSRFKDVDDEMMRYLESIAPPDNEPQVDLYPDMDIFPSKDN